MEDLRVLGPGDDGARRHQQRQVAHRKALARERGQRHHGGHLLAPLRRGQLRHARQHDGGLLGRRQVVQAGDQVPAVELGVVEHLRAVVQAAEVALAQGVHGGEEAELRMRLEHALLVQQGEAALAFEHALDDEHHVGPARVVFIEDQGHGPLQRPGQDALLELRDLTALLQHDGVLAHQVQPADVAVEVDTHAGPVQPRRHLLDMGGLARAVQALDDHAPVVRKAGKDGQRGLRVEAVGRVHGRHMLAAFGKGGHLHVGVQAEGLAHAKRARGMHQGQLSHRQGLPGGLRR